jgi:hypothetical protein
MSDAEPVYSEKREQSPEKSQDINLLRVQAAQRHAEIALKQLELEREKFIWEREKARQGTSIGNWLRNNANIITTFLVGLLGVFIPLY